MGQFSMGMNIGHFICIFLEFCIFGFQRGLGGLGVLATYKINRGIKLVLGRVNDWVQGGFQSI